MKKINPNKELLTSENEQPKQQENKLDLKNDIIFKTFFARKGNEYFLIDFLEALLKIEIIQIQVKEEVNLEQLSSQEKGGRLDLQAELNDGIIINIELQLENQYNMAERTTYYSSKVIARETKRGTEYQDIKQVIMINILNFEMLGFEEYISKTAIVLENHREYEVLKGIKWYFIELPKFRRGNPDMNEKINQWVAFMDNYDRGLVEMAEEKNETLKKARIEMNYLTGNEEVRRLAELQEKWEMDYKSVRRAGKEEGSQAEKQAIAKKMLDKKLPIALIQEITQLTQEEIKKLIPKIGKERLTTSVNNE